MSRVGFYHLQRSSLDQALPPLLGKALAAGHRVLLLAGSMDRVAHLDAHLWTFDAAAFLPHGTLRDGSESLQPIFLSDRDDNPNQADLLVLTDGVAPPPLDSFSRVLMLFDGQDEVALSQARQRWKDWAAAGHQLTYYQQTDRGGWQQKASLGAVSQGENDAEG